MKKQETLYTAFIIIAIAVLSFLLVIVNYNNVKKSEANNAPTKRSTTNKTALIKDTIYIEGEKESIEVLKYKTDLGFTLRYEPKFFTVGSDNEVIKVTNIDDKKIYLLIEVLTESEYEEERLKILTKDDHRDKIIDGYRYSYNILKGNNFYLKITKSIKDSSEYEGMSARLDYITSALYEE